MQISTYVCGSCAVASIAGVGDHKNAVEVLKTFCKSQLGVIDLSDPWGAREYQKLNCYYIFCAGPEVPSTSKGGTGHSKDHWPRYGTEFAAFLTENNLGEVVTVGPKLNLKHHPQSTAQLWAWSPNQEAVEKWWKKNGGK